jgi:hypothetical protein
MRRRPPAGPNGHSGSPTSTQWPGSGPPTSSPGHKKVDNDNDPKIIEETQQYDFSEIAAEETTTAGIVARMVERYPDWENLRTLWHSARAAIARQGR